MKKLIIIITLFILLVLTGFLINYYIETSDGKYTELVSHDSIINAVGANVVFTQNRHCFCNCM